MEELKHEKIGAFAKNAKMFAKYLTAESYKRVIHFIMLNHQYDTIGGFGISTKKSTGGEWVSLMPCMRLQTTLVKSEKVDNTDVSQLTEIKVIKNDFGSRTTTTVRILLGYGIIPSDEEIEYLMDKGLVIRKGLSAKGFGVAVGSIRELRNSRRNEPKLFKVLERRLREEYMKDLEAEKNSNKNSKKD